MKKLIKNDKRGAFIGSLLGVSLLAFLISFNFVNPLDVFKLDRKNVRESEHIRKYETVNDRLEGSSPFTIGANQQFVVAPLGVDVTEHYLVDTKFVSEVDKDVPVQKEEGVEYKIVTMAIDENFARKEYDVYQAAEQYKKGAKVNKYVDALTYNGQDLAIITLVKDIKSKEIDEYASLDLSSGKMSSLPEELKSLYNNPERKGDYYDYYQEPFAQTTLNSLLDKYNLYGSYNILHLESDSSQSDSNSSKTLNLFTEYTKDSLWNRIYEEPAYGIYPRPESVSVEEWFNTALHWFVPVSSEDLTVYGIVNYRSSDGHVSDYPIQSYADYQAFKATQSGE